MGKLIPSADVPQADRLSEVFRVVEAVGRGASTFEEIGRQIDKVDRQGRYYRRAAEILGLIQRRGINKSALTPAGKALLEAGTAKRAEHLAKAMASTPIFRALLSFLASKGTTGATRSEITNYLEGIAELGAPSMAPRRVSTISSWLVESGLAVEKSRGHLCASGLKVEGELAVEAVPDGELLFPEKLSLDDFVPGIKKKAEAKGIIEVLVDETKKERATDAHQALVNKMADLLNSVGLKPKANRYVDLASAAGDSTYIFEMKSLTDENFVSQIRKGISQLYEYRYLQCLSDAILVLVLEKQIPSKSKWLEKYLLEDRGIIPIWVEGERFICPDVVKGRLKFLRD